VDRVEAVVSVQLLNPVLARVAVAAMHLDREVVGDQTPLRRPCLGDRSKDVEQQRQSSLGGFIGRDRLLIDQMAAVQTERKAAFDVRLLGEQHPSHIAVLNDRHLGR